MTAKPFAEQVTPFDAAVPQMRCPCGFVVSATSWASASASMTAHRDHCSAQTQESVPVPPSQS